MTKEIIVATGDVLSIRQELNRDMIITIRIDCPSVFFEHHFHFGDRVKIEQQLRGEGNHLEKRGE